MLPSYLDYNVNKIPLGIIKASPFEDTGRLGTRNLRRYGMIKYLFSLSLFSFTTIMLHFDTSNTW